LGPYGLQREVGDGGGAHRGGVGEGSGLGEGVELPESEPHAGGPEVEDDDVAHRAAAPGSIPRTG
jgi:hypothetical protein